MSHLRKMIVLFFIPASLNGENLGLEFSQKTNLHRCLKTPLGYYAENPLSCRYYFVCDSIGRLYDGDCGPHGVYHHPSIACLRKGQTLCNRDNQHSAHSGDVTNLVSGGQLTTTVSVPQYKKFTTTQMPKRLTFPSGEVGQTRNVNPYTEKMHRLPTLTSVPQSVQTSNQQIQPANSLDHLKEAKIDTTTLHPTTLTGIIDPEADTRQDSSTLAEVSKSVEPTFSQPTNSWGDFEEDQVQIATTTLHTTTHTEINDPEGTQRSTILAKESKSVETFEAITEVLDSNSAAEKQAKKDTAAQKSKYEMAPEDPKNIDPLRKADEPHVGKANVESIKSPTFEKDDDSKIVVEQLKKPVTEEPTNGAEPELSKGLMIQFNGADPVAKNIEDEYFEHIEQARSADVHGFEEYDAYNEYASYDEYATPNIVDTHDVLERKKRDYGLGGDYDSSYSDVLDSLNFGPGPHADYNAPQFDGLGVGLEPNARTHKPIVKNDCHYHKDGLYISQELILGGCVKYISCLDGEKEVKGCLPGLTFDWKVSNCVPPEANTVTDCQDEGVHREGQSNLEDFLMEEELSTIDTQLHEQCRFKNDGNYISQELISEGCKVYISCVEGQGRFQPCPDALTFDWKVSGCVHPSQNTVSSCKSS